MNKDHARCSFPVRVVHSQKVACLQGLMVLLCFFLLHQEQQQLPLLSLPPEVLHQIASPVPTPEYARTCHTLNRLQLRRLSVHDT